MISAQTEKTLSTMKAVGLGATPIDNAIRILSYTLQFPPTAFSSNSTINNKNGIYRYR
jgi:hypothetical protein